MQVRSIRQVRAFIASPGGLEEERQAAREAALEVNNLLGQDLGIQVEMYGWEDTISGLGRAQSIINAEMDLCEIFIGLIWRKWGTKPDIDGRFTSGFEEEFSLSVEKSVKSGWPNIHMFFKKVDPSQEADPGPDLKKVIDFRQKLQNEKKVLYQIFETPEEFGREVQRILSKFVIEKFKESTERESIADSESTGVRSTQSAKPDQSVEAPTSLQFFESVRKSISEGKFPQISAVEMARLRLAGMLCDSDHNDTLRLEVHDVNLLFRNRRTLDLKKIEKRFLLTSSLSELSDETYPLWEWFHDLRKGEIKLAFKLTAQGEEDERVNAFKLIEWLGLELDPSSQEVVGFVNEWLSDKSPRAIRIAAMQLLGVSGHRKFVAQLETLEQDNDPEIALLANRTIIQILLRCDRNAGAEKLLKSTVEKMDGPTLSQALDCFHLAATDLLQSALNHRLSQVRERALEILFERGEAGEETLIRALDDPSRDVRLKAFQLLDKINKQVPIVEAAKRLTEGSAPRGLLFPTLSSSLSSDNEHVDDLRRSRLDLLTLDELEKARDEGGRLAPFAWIKLAELDFKRHGPALRDQISSAFDALIEPKDGLGGGGGALSALLFNPTTQRKRSLMAASLSLLAERKNPSDLALIVKSIAEDAYLFEDRVSDYIGEFGSKDTGIGLVHAVSSKRQFEKMTANHRKMFANMIISLVKDADRLLGDIRIATKIKVEIIKSLSQVDFGKVSQERIFKLLDHQSDDIRSATALRFVQVSTKSEIAKMMDRLFEEGKYYYNSIFWLDLGNSFSRAEARAIVGRVLESR